MFGMGFTEIFLIAVVAIIALGPDKLPTVMVQVAKFFKQVKTQVNDAKESIENEMKISELKEEANIIKTKLENSVADIKNTHVGIDLDEIKRDFENIETISNNNTSDKKLKHPKNRYVNSEKSEQKEDNV